MSRRQALNNLVCWEEFKGEGYVYPVGPLGFVPHPRKESQRAALQYAYVQGSSCIIRERYIEITVRRKRLEKPRFWFNKPPKSSQALKYRTLRIDTYKHRKVVSSVVDKVPGLVLYDAGPAVDYRLIATTHLEKVRQGLITSRGDPIPEVSALSTPSTPSSPLVE